TKRIGLRREGEEIKARVGARESLAAQYAREFGAPHLSLQPLSFAAFADDQEAEIAGARFDQASFQFRQQPHVLLRRQPPDVSDQERAVAAKTFCRREQRSINAASHQIGWPTRLAREQVAQLFVRREERAA